MGSEEASSPVTKTHRVISYIRRFCLFLGPIIAVLIYFALPDTYTNSSQATIVLQHETKACIAITFLMALYWFSETIPIASTALIPLVAFPLLGIMSIEETCTPYGSNTVFLFLGGFILSTGIQRWNLNRRLALYTIRFIGTSPKQINVALMIATAILAMWVSNTATVAMMVPVVAAILHLFHSELQENKKSKNFAICMLLGIAYAASIGGMGTILGSPPNGIFVNFLNHTYGIEISILSWMKLGIPLVLILLPVTWWLLNQILFKDQIDSIPGGQEWIKEEIKKLGPLSSGEKTVFFIFLLTVALWITCPFLRHITLSNGTHPFAFISDASIAIFGSLLLFILPINKRFTRHALTWQDCGRLPLGLLLLFGGGLSLAAAIHKTHCDELLNAQMAYLSNLSPFLIILGIATIVIFATELTSNTALAATLMPLMASTAGALGADPKVLLLVTTFGASAAFMMPVATPPNAIVFGTGHVRIGDMIRAGFWLNIISILVISLCCWFGAPLIFD